MRKLLLIMFCALPFCIFAKDRMYTLYQRAIQQGHSRGVGDFIVITVTDGRTGTTREYCTMVNFLSGAIHTEYALDHDMAGLAKADSIALSHQDRTFTFSNPKALNNIDYHYTINELQQLQRSVNFDSIATVLQSGKEIWIWNDKTIAMYAHILFKRGIGIATGTCEGGAIWMVPDGR